MSQEKRKLELVDECKKYNLSDEQIAYVLATVDTETAGNFKPEKEIGYNFNGPYGSWRVNALNELFCYRNESLMETYLESKCPNLFYGRGLIPLRWYDNYEYASRRLFDLGLGKCQNELLEAPDVALEDCIAKTILICSMVEGWFTGKKLSDYINEEKCDFASARKIFENKADVKIGELASKYLEWIEGLNASNASNDSDTEAKKPTRKSKTSK